MPILGDQRDGMVWRDSVQFSSGGKTALTPQRLIPPTTGDPGAGWHISRARSDLVQQRFPRHIAQLQFAKTQRIPHQVNVRVDEARDDQCAVQVFDSRAWRIRPGVCLRIHAHDMTVHNRQRPRPRTFWVSGVNPRMTKNSYHHISLPKKTLQV